MELRGLDAATAPFLYLAFFEARDGVNRNERIILWWIVSAKRPMTRAARVAETVRLVAENIRANHWRQPAKRE